MKKKQFVLLLILLTLLLAGLTSFAVGKYVMTLEKKTGTVTFTARLAQEVALREHRAVRQANGTYSLTEATGTENSYVLIPGLDIDKDPHVVITGKTDIPAYLYVEIVTDTIDSYDGMPIVNYTIGRGWGESERPAQHGGAVYEYVGTGASALALTADNLPQNPIYIFENNKVRVSQHAKHADHTADGDTDVLEIYGYLIEATGG